MLTSQSSLVLEAWGGQKVTVHKSIQGTNNQTLLLATDDRELVLRLYRTVDQGRIAEEHQLLLALQHSGLPFAIPAPIPTTSGSTTTELVWQGRPVLAALFPMLPGSPPEDGNPAHVSACGRALGQLHTATAGLPDSLNVGDACPTIDRIDPHVPDPITAAADCGRDPSQRRQLASAVRNVMSTNPDDDEQPQVIHADLFRANLLMQDDEISAVLDFECAGLGPAAMDLAVATLSLCLSPLTRADRWTLIGNFAAGYASTRALPAQTVEAVPTMMRRREVVSFVTRIGRHRRNEITTAELNRRADTLVELDRWLAAHAHDLIQALSAPIR